MFENIHLSPTMGRFANFACIAGGGSLLKSLISGGVGGRIIRFYRRVEK